MTNISNKQKSTYKSWYGKTPMWRSYCKECKTYAFVVNGKLQCCDKEIESPDKFKKERVTGTYHKRRHLSKNQKETILEKQKYRCVYCNSRLINGLFYTKNQELKKIRIHYDHFKPWCYDQDDSFENFFATCHRCNGCKSSKVFNKFEEAKEYIIKRRIQKGDIFGDDAEERYEIECKTDLFK